MIALLLACQTASHPYLQALERLDPRPCLELDQPARGECVVSTAEDLARAGRLEEAHRACTLADGVWMDECHFLLADALDARFEDADALCALAGRHQPQCMAHAIHREAQDLEDQGLDEGARIERLTQRWSEVVSPQRARAEAERMVLGEAATGRPRSPR